MPVPKINQPYLMSKAQYEELCACKQRFLSGEELTDTCECLRPEVARSWQRSKAASVDAYARITGIKLPQAVYHRILRDNVTLIDIARPIVDLFAKLMEQSCYEFFFLDRCGTALLCCGKLSKENPRQQPGRVTGYTLDELSGGTQSHVLAMEYNCPVQLVGAETYNEYAPPLNTFAPIVDAHDRIIGTVGFVIRTNLEVWENDFHVMQIQTMGWVGAIALAISQQLNLQDKFSELERSNQMVETIMTFLDESLIMIDGESKILKLNQPAINLLGLAGQAMPAELKGYFNSDSHLLAQIAEGRSFDYTEDILKTTKGSMSVLISSRPVPDKDHPARNGAVIRISSIKKMYSVASSSMNTSTQIDIDSIIGESVALNKVKDLALRFAETGENIYLCGESGVGKELFARSIHQHSRPNGAFVAVNCAALPHSLIESELFGYEGGSFTGAERKGRIGKIELANNGTLFLDEIGDMPQELQSVLLRVIEDKQVTRIGGTTPRNVDFRLVVATNRHILKMVEENLFRKDLYFRIATFKIEIPPLSARDKDVLILSEYFLHKYCAKMNSAPLRLHPAVRELFLQYNWPGNVRQLEKTIGYAATVCNANVIEISHLPDELQTFYLRRNQKSEQDENKRFQPERGVQTIKEVEKEAIYQALCQTDYNITAAAALVGLSKSTLYKKIKEYAL